ncbi:Hpt domain-containing response regulator [Paraburkholderia sp. GAS334]|uniref:response regulator n=1 Tax=Paraburkholderia sp. GAS334 TaxID=3035131 RepID=UPI003D1A3C94
MGVSPVTSSGTLSGRVLVVEDHAFNRLAIEVQLEGWGVSCVAVSSGEEALEVLRRQSFDLLMTDLHLPGMNGVQLAEYVREVSSMPLVLLTGREDMRYADAASGLPFDAVLIKASQFDALYTCLWQLLPRFAGTPSAPLASPVNDGDTALAFDFSELDALASRGVDVRALVRDWRRVLDEDLTHLEAARRQDDPEAVRRLLHRISNAASVFKVRELMAVLEHVGAASPAFMMQALDGIVSRIKTMEEQVDAWRDAR